MHLEPDVPVSDELVASLAGALRACASWHATPDVLVRRSDPPELAGALGSMLNGDHGNDRARRDRGWESLVWAYTRIAFDGAVQERGRMSDDVNPIPRGFHTVTPYMTIKGAYEAIEFYKEAFGAEEIFRWADPDGRVRHAEVVIGDSPIMLTDEAPDFGMYGPRSLGGSPVHMFLYVEDVDAVFERAISAGATELMPVENSEDGDRRGGVTDPFGHVWYIATHVEGISREELQRRYDAATSQ